MPARDVATVPQVCMVAMLVGDFATALDGSVHGLTWAELLYAWRARHGSVLPEWAVCHASQSMQIDRYPKRRTCDVSGAYRRPWVPAALMPSRAPCS